MAELLEMYNSMSGCSLSDLQAVLSVISEHQTVNFKDKSILTDITELLQRAGTRARGLLTLQCLLRCTVSCEDVLLEKASTWLALCVSSLKSPRDQPLAYSVIGSLLEKCSSVHELDRTVLQNSLPDLAASFVNCSPNSHIQALQCLQTLLHRYSKASGAHKSAIEKFLVKFLDSANKRVVVYAAKCAHLLQQVRGGGEQGVNHKIAWKNQLDILIESIYSILAQLYSQSEDSYGIDSIECFSAKQNNKQNAKAELNTNIGPLHVALKNILEINDIEDGVEDFGNPVIVKAIRLSTRLQNLLVFVQSMLVDPFPVNKRINCRSILSLLIRCQSAVSGKPSPASMESSLHCAISDTLRALTFCLKGNILPYSSLLMKMALPTLDWSKTKDHHFGIKPLKNVRKSAYSALSTILRSVHTLRLPSQQGDQSFEDKIFEHMLQDIVPHRVTIQLTVKTNPGGAVKNMSKKARRKMTMSQLEASSISGQKLRRNGDWPNGDLATAALECMGAIFAASGNFFKATTHQIVQESLVRMLYSPGHRPAAVGLLLLRTLGQLQQNSSGGAGSPASHCLNILSAAQSQSHMGLSSFAHLALHSSLTSIRGAVPPILIPKVIHSDSSSGQGKPSLEPQSGVPQTHGHTNGDVIEVGDSIENTSEDNESTTGSEMDVNTKKRKRSRPSNLRKVISNSSDVSSPAGKRVKIVEELKPTEEIHSSGEESSDDEPLDETIVVDENLSDDVVIMDDVIPEKDASSNDLRESRDQNCTVVDFVKSSREIDVGNIPDHSNPEKEVAAEVSSELGAAESSIDSRENQTVIAEKECEVVNNGTTVTIEEMLGSFVDEVNEELK